jgi:hypothetical protein
MIETLELWQDESKKAMLCQILMIDIGEGKYGDPTVEPLKSLLKHFKNCFKTRVYEALTLEQINDALTEAWDNRKTNKGSSGQSPDAEVDLVGT